MGEPPKGKITAYLSLFVYANLCKMIFNLLFILFVQTTNAQYYEGEIHYYNEYEVMRVDEVMIMFQFCVLGFAKLTDEERESYYSGTTTVFHSPPWFIACKSTQTPSPDFLENDYEHAYALTLENAFAEYVDAEAIGPDFPVSETAEFVKAEAHDDFEFDLDANFDEELFHVDDDVDVDGGDAVYDDEHDDEDDDGTTIAEIDADDDDDVDDDHDIQIAPAFVKDEPLSDVSFDEGGEEIDGDFSIFGDRPASEECEFAQNICNETLNEGTDSHHENNDEDEDDEEDGIFIEDYSSL